MWRASIAIAVLACGCGADDLDAPDDCAVDELHIVHGARDERMTVTNHIFVNKIGADPGVLNVGSSGTGSTFAEIEFNKLIANGDEGAARGRVTLPSGLDVGNCETSGFSGRIFVDDGYYRWELVELHEAPYCSGAKVTTALGGCYRSE
jgi:hypothetical protein